MTRAAECRRLIAAMVLEGGQQRDRAEKAERELAEKDEEIGRLEDDLEDVRRALDEEVDVTNARTNAECELAAARAEIERLTAAMVLEGSWQRARAEQAELELARVTAERDAWKGAVAWVRHAYPESVFVPGGTSIDAQSADWARRVCDNITAEAEQAIRALDAAREEKNP